MSGFFCGAFNHVVSTILCSVCSAALRCVNSGRLLVLVAYSCLLPVAFASSRGTYFPDYDCIRFDKHGQEESLFDWLGWLELLENRTSGWLDSSGVALAAITEDTRDRAVVECAVGTLFSDILRTLVCYIRGGAVSGGCYELYSSRVQRQLADLGFRVLMGTRWPIYEALTSEIWQAHGEVALASMHDCDAIEQPILDWKRFREMFNNANWYQSAVDVAYGPELEQGWRHATGKCPLGFAMANVIKAMLCAHTESICFRSHAFMIDETLRELPLHVVGGSRWPIWTMLSNVSRALQRHSFHLDFTPKELVGELGDTEIEEPFLLNADLHRLRGAHSLLGLPHSLP